MDTDTFDKYALLGYRKSARRRRTGAPGAFWQGLALCLPGPMPAVPGSASRLPCLVGRAFTPAGEVGGGGRVRGGRNRPPCIAPVGGRQYKIGSRTSSLTAGRRRDRSLAQGPAACRSRFCLPLAVYCRAGVHARRGALRHRKVSGTMPASSPADTGQGPAGLYRIFPPQSGNAPLRLRLAAHPPPLAGEALGGLPPIKPPLQGEVSPQATEGCGTLPCQYPSGVAQISPAGVHARRGSWRRQTGSRRAKSPAQHRARRRVAAQERRPQVRADGGPVQGSPPCPGGGGLPFPVLPPVCPVL